MQDIDKIALKDQGRGNERTAYQRVQEEIETSIKVKVDRTISERYAGTPDAEQTWSWLGTSDLKV